ncbi:hypothetical protein OGZ02_13875 [Brachyspira hyodysenteriae]|nr:hypothetical protein [Brachyspira hyodysenteriae]MDA1469887.1 hypothetical protein [Brachyspira hyodysenteriae]
MQKCSNREKIYFSLPNENLLWSYGSGYGGNALPGKRCFALRITSAMARRRGWMFQNKCLS